jgi:hypothetical protein
VLATEVARDVGGGEEEEVAVFELHPDEYRSRRRRVLRFLPQEERRSVRQTAQGGDRAT